MRDGVDGIPLAADPATPFSRYLRADHMFGRPVFERPVRLLAAVAAPADLGEYDGGLPALDVEKEKTALREALRDVPASDLEIVFVEGPVTLAALRDELARPGRNVHVLHLLAHGVFDEQKGGALCLVDPEDGKVALAREDDLAALVGEHKEVLRLVVLASCEGAKRGSADAFRGLAPKLVAAGTPAVLAMQEKVGVDDARTFTAAFFRHLLADGIVDLAANRARAALLAAKSPDAGAPVLFLRLREGRLFGRHGEIQGESADLFWSNLLLPLTRGGCIPILGPGVTEGLFPSPFELARELPAPLRLPYPFPEGGDNLPRVAQFVGALNEKLPRTEVLRLLTRAFRRRFGLPQSEEGEERLSDALRDGGWARLSAAQEETEIHRQLAGFARLPIYLTTNYDNLMTLALEAAGRKPQRRAFPWREEDPGLAAEGTADEPLVCHLFGTDQDLKSMVLTEDDHLDFLASVSRSELNRLWPQLRLELGTSEVLLFLGYRLHDLDFKVLLRFLARIDSTFDRFQLAVQIDPLQAAAEGCDNARTYLENYFDRQRIQIYWGTAREFVAELHDRLEEHRRG
jgi:hypothetical protein